MQNLSKLQNASKNGNIKIPKKKEKFKQLHQSNDTQFLSEKEARRLFNKYVKYRVSKTFGADILLQKQIRELDRDKMNEIKG